MVQAVLRRYLELMVFIYAQELKKMFKNSGHCSQVVTTQKYLLAQISDVTVHEIKNTPFHKGSSALIIRVR